MEMQCRRRVDKRVQGGRMGRLTQVSKLEEQGGVRRITMKGDRRQLCLREGSRAAAANHQGQEIVCGNQNKWEV